MGNGDILPTGKIRTSEILMIQKAMSRNSLAWIGLINGILMSFVFFFGFSAAKEHDRNLSNIRDQYAQVRYPINRAVPPKIEATNTDIRRGKSR